MGSQSKRSSILLPLAVLALPAWSGVAAQSQASDPNIVVNGMQPQEAVPTTPGPDVKGTITARSGSKMKVTADDGTSTVIVINDATKVKAASGFLGSSKKLGAEALLNGIPVTVKTLKAADGSLVASQISFKNADLKTANMIRNGTNQRFEEQAAATEALRGRMGDIDQYNIKNTTNVFFDTGKAQLSAQAKAELCEAAAAAENTNNALLLVVGYTDSVGSEEYNQTLSEKRAGSVINYLQQACHWKPYRMLTPTGMAEADPMASNDTPEGKAQNRRVSVNVLVSKGLDGL
ncbi:MAG: OmpA family protein [Sphingobium sp.]|jgi:OOP family OmpA-OmpF porin|nr:OmpA family protein [Sphingobium sp.]MCI1271691.1 OmpA family protein [Sphingobium sp.]MCI2054130.1 OmpA family protein [Sphingobium sp.]